MTNRVWFIEEKIKVFGLIFVRCKNLLNKVEFTSIKHKALGYSANLFWVKKKFNNPQRQHVFFSLSMNEKNKKRKLMVS